MRFKVRDFDGGFLSLLSKLGKEPDDGAFESLAFHLHQHRTPQATGDGSSPNDDDSKDCDDESSSLPKSSSLKE